MKRPLYKIRVSREIAGLIRTLHPHLKRKIKASLQSILSDPRIGKALKGELAGLCSLPVSKFRIIYRISRSKQIEIVAIGPRHRIYEETLRLIKREQNRVSSEK